VTTTIYRPPSNRPLIGAVGAAVMIHICAVALASRRAAPSVESSASITGEITAIDPIEEPAPVEIIDMAPPPPASIDFGFVEQRAPPLVRSRPIRPVVPARARPNMNPRALALSAPQPEYPYEARSRHITGSGIAALRVDGASGTVLDASMEQSMGSPILDRSALAIQDRNAAHVRVPIIFTMTGAQF
jgi:TonB family protein